MILRPTRSTRPDTLVPHTTLFRSRACRTEAVDHRAHPHPPLRRREQACDHLAPRVIVVEDVHDDVDATRRPVDQRAEAAQPFGAVEDQLEPVPRDLGGQAGRGGRGGRIGHVLPIGRAAPGGQAQLLLDSFISTNPATISAAAISRNGVAASPSTATPTTKAPPAPPPPTLS